MLRFLSLAFVATQLAALAVVQSVGAGAAKSTAFAARSSDRFRLDDEGDDFEFDLDIASKQKLKNVQQRFDGDETIEAVTSTSGGVSSSSVFSTKVRPSGMNYGRGTRYVTTQTVLKGEVLFTVPYRDVISLESARQGRIKALMDANPGMPTSIILAAHLLEERFLGETSRFYEYIQALPPSRGINSTTFYSEQDLQQLQGSHLFRLTHARSQGMANYFDALAGPITSHAVEPPLFTAAQFTKENFDWAMATVWARAFSLTENENEVVIAPILDTIGLCLDSDCPENDVELDHKGRRIVVYAPQDYAKGEEVLMSLGVAKPTSLLMMNHGLARTKPSSTVETMEVSIFLDPNDSLLSIKTHLLESHNMTINGSYVLRYQGDQLDPQLIRSLKTKLLTASELDKHQQLTEDDNGEAYPIVSLRNEFVFTRALVTTCKNLLAQYPTTLAQDKAQLERLGRDRSDVKKAHILRALLTEKEILQHTMDAALKKWSDLLLLEDVAKLI